MTENNAAQPGENLLDYAMAIAHERELDITGHKHDSDGAVRRFKAAVDRALLSKLRAEGVQAGGFPAYINDDSQPLQYRLGWNNCLSDCRAALASAPVAGQEFKAAFPNGVLTSARFHELWERAGKTRNGNYTLLENLTWQVGQFGNLVAQAVTAPVAGEAKRNANGAPPCWWIDHGSHGQITQREDEAQRAADEGKRVVSYTAAPQASEAVRNQALEEAAQQCEDIYSWRGAYSAGVLHQTTLDACASAIRALTTQADKDGECKPCNGMGFIDGVGDRCPACNGDGGDRAKGAGDVDKLRAALILARDSHRVVLLSDPPQDAWKARRVDEVIRAALAAQPGAQRNDPWQPIETAPKDQVILLFAGLKKDGKVYAPHVNVGYWTEQFGWTCLVYSHQEFAHIEPTHWMPRPDFPQQPRTDGGGRE